MKFTLSRIMTETVLQKRKDTLISRLLLLFPVSLLLLQLCMIRAEAGQSHVDAGIWLRVRPEILFSENTDESAQEQYRKLISEDDISYNPENWLRRGEYYYYRSRVGIGETVEFMDGFRIAEKLAKEAEGLSFRLVITAQAAEVFPGDKGYEEPGEAVFLQSPAEYAQGLNSDQSLVRNGVSIVIREYSLENGRLVDYQNDRIVMPGEYVSKIVCITPEGEVSRKVTSRSESSQETTAAQSSVQQTAAVKNGRTAPKTGENDTALFWELILLLCAVGMTALILHKKLRSRISRKNSER